MKHSRSAARRQLITQLYQEHNVCCQNSHRLLRQTRAAVTISSTVSFYSQFWDNPSSLYWTQRFAFNTLRPRQNGRHFAEDTPKRIFLNGNVRILIEISLMLVPKGPINNTPALVLIMAWHRTGDKPLSEPMMVRLLTHICITRRLWVKRVLTPMNWWVSFNWYIPLFLSLYQDEMN